MTAESSLQFIVIRLLQFFRSRIIGVCIDDDGQYIEPTSILPKSISLYGWKWTVDRVPAPGVQIGIG